MKNPMTVMVWMGLTRLGATKVYFVPVGDTIDTLFYYRRILPFAKKDGQRIFGNQNWVFQQDCATCHTSGPSQLWCTNNLGHI
jgi:hypothetical protein